MRAWLTPDSSLFSNPLDCRTLTIPGDLWLYVQGALELLTKEYNWQLYGTATPEETAVFFMGVIDAFGNSECDTMQFINELSYPLINNESYTQSGQVFLIEHSDLPLDAQGCKGILCRFNINHSVANQTIQFEEKSGNAISFLMGTTASITHRFQAWIPMDADGCHVRSLSANGTLVTLGVFLVGWHR